MTVKLFVPKSYNELSQAQARWIFRTLTKYPDMNTMVFKTMAFLHFSGLKVITRFEDTEDFLVKSGHTIFRIAPEQIAIATRSLDWILFPPKYPWCPNKIAWRTTPDPRLFDLPFGNWLAIDNLYQGYIHTQDPQLLRKIASIILPKFRRPLKDWELQAIFRWIISVKEFYTSRFSHFFVPVSGDGNLGSSAPSPRQIEDAMNAQIRALTKGDIAKEQQILQMPTLRALIELDAQAREFQELNKKTSSNH